MIQSLVRKDKVQDLVSHYGQVIVDECHRAYAALTAELADRITVKPEQCGGRPCIRGMCIRVKDVLDMLADGATSEDILADFPDLQPEDIRAAIAFAARYLDHPIIVAA